MLRNRLVVKPLSAIFFYKLILLALSLAYSEMLKGKRELLKITVNF